MSGVIPMLTTIMLSIPTLLLLFPRLIAGFSTTPFGCFSAMTSLFLRLGLQDKLISFNGFTSLNQPGLGMEGGNVAI